jgi:hypothetical protein
MQHAWQPSRKPVSYLRAKPHIAQGQYFSNTLGEAAKAASVIVAEGFSPTATRPAHECAGYRYEARLRGLPDYFLKLHKLRATATKPACAG